MSERVVVVCPDAISADVMRSLIDGLVARRGADNVPAAIALASVAVIPEHSPSLRATQIINPAPDPHHAVMTYEQAAEHFDVSTTTIGRWVRDGRLVKVGRKISRDSIDRLTQERTS